MTSTLAASSFGEVIVPIDLPTAFAGGNLPDGKIIAILEKVEKVF